MAVSKEIIAWRTIVEILNQTGYYGMYEEEVAIVADLIRKEQALEKENTRYKKLIDLLRKESLYYEELDYDYEENPFTKNEPFDLDEFIKNMLEGENNECLDTRNRTD